jgi:hypothetical protein
MRPRQQTVAVVGNYGNIEYTLRGPADMITAIMKFIKNLNNMTNGGLNNTIDNTKA